MALGVFLPVVVVLAFGLGYWIAKQVPDELKIGKPYLLATTGVFLIGCIGLWLLGAQAHALELWQAGIALALLLGTDVYILFVARVGTRVSRRKPI